MKFLVDAQLPPGLCRWLEERGHTAVHVTERGGWLRCGNATNRALAEWHGARSERVENLLENGETLIELV